MKIKKRTIVRVLFIIMFNILIATIAIKYSSFERRILLFEMVRGIASLYAVVVEFPLAIARNLSELNNCWKRFLLFLVCTFAVFSIYVVGVDIYHLSNDVFIGYHEKNVTIIKREKEYKASDRVWVDDDSKVMRFYLAPGYVNVNVGETYSMRIFEKSQIAIPLNKIE
ncbi:hypothetical protein [Paenibacillus sp. FSL H8-0332]|uniref:hypothetical protein n=1 Tax=Paenibacillus sp. FSL H8-0332 TaxID=2954742 RepID=UPI0030CAE4BD